MKNVIYLQLIKDIEKEKNAYVRKQLLLLQQKIDKTISLIGNSFTNEDILIIISDYDDYLSKLFSGTYDDDIRINMSTIQNNIEKYFKLVDYNGETVNSGKLSNGVYFSDFEKENVLYNKAIQSRNKVAMVIKMIAVTCFIISFLVFFALISSESPFNLPILISSWIGCIFVYSLGEVIQIIHDIRRSIYKRDTKF